MKFNLADLDLQSWLLDLKKDKDALIDLLNNARIVTPERDAKLKELKTIIADKIKTPINGSSKKVIVFTAFADTAEYLYENLKDWIKKDLKLNPALICGNKTKTKLGKNDYDSILVNFSPISKNREKIDSLLFGLYAVVPAPGRDLNKSKEFSSAENDIIKPGVIFCLRQKGDCDGNEEVNPLNPYFLVYIREDGTVRYNYTHAKQVLEIFLCSVRIKRYLMTIFANCLMKKH